MSARGRITLWSAALAASLAAGAARAQETPTERAPVPAGPAAPRYRASLEYGLTTFRGGGSTDPWHTATAELSRRGGGATLVGRANYAHRFGQDGVQVEADAYPRLTRRTYAYLNAGYSPSEIFPELRLGAELYTGFGRGGEASLGARRLEFADEGVTLLTGSLGAYAGNYYFSARPYVAPLDEGTSRSVTVLARRYLADGDSHVTLSAGAGTAPTESPLQFELRRVSSRRVGAYGRLPVRPGVGVRWSAGYEREEITRGAPRDRFNVGVGAERRF